MSISLLGSINVCKVNTGYADKIQSDRFENPDAMTCPLWNGQDSFGRYVHPDSFYTKNGGCNSADDRVSVEKFPPSSIHGICCIGCCWFSLTEYVW